ncbi:MAG: phosphodiester glycosidase family protein, partial [Oscillospiraceae bacterium]|nr:phosphodiester glycosidase family protein [Oscillospiraceae bacterium]
GWKAYETCSRCDYTTYEVIDALGHDPVQHEGKAASCLEGGWKAYETCSRCDYTTYEVIDALGHDPVQHEGKAATCLEAGWKAYETCTRCDYTTYEGIDALGHDPVQHEGKAPTYVSAGWEAYETCTRCNYTTYKQLPVLAVPAIDSYESFLTNLVLLEELANVYVQQNPAKDPLALVIKYIRTGVDRYNSGSWGIMAGYEDADFAKFVQQMQDSVNAEIENIDEMILITALKEIKNFDLPNGDRADLGHMFGTMDITYHNNFSVNHADVAGWAGDLVDLLSTADRHNVSGTMDEMVADIAENYLCKSLNESDIFSLADMYGDLDGYYIMQVLQTSTYENGMLTQLISDYFTEDLNDVDRAAYFLRNRLDGVSIRSSVRDAVYSAYTGNKVVATLENTRDFTSDNLIELKKACCYAFADYLCRLAGDFVDVTENPYYTVFSEEEAVLAPGITQQIKMAMSADNKQMVFYLATADLPRDDIQIYVNYKDNDPSQWGMARVLDQAIAAQEKYGNPESEHYIQNYNVIASINADGYNMATGEPGGLLVMDGVEWHPVDGGGFFAILKDGTAMIGTKDDYETNKSRIQEGVGGFGTTLVKDGEICITRSDSYYSNRASRTAIGITRTGKVVFMVLDGRQEPFSCGGSMEEIAQIMLEAGCVHAINLDGGGSSTFVAKQEGENELRVMNRPSDGTPRSVSTSLIMVSTAPSSTAFSHAILNSKADYLTVNSTVQLVPMGVSATGNAAELPDGTSWAVSDERWGSITEDGVFTALRNGDVDVYLMLGDEIIGSKTLHIVIPTQVYFEKENVDTVYGQTVALPVKVLYEGKNVVVRPEDLVFTMSNPAAGTMNGFSFTGNESAGVKNVRITAALAMDSEATASIKVSLYNQGEATFDFDQATGGDRQLAWDRQVSNSTTDDQITYTVVDPEKDMVTSYIIALDMTQIPIPGKLEDLIYMLPGADMENASAWNFLLQLAERVSVLTEVTPVIYFDPNFHVDCSKLTVLNEYFSLSEAEFDEATNSVRLVLNWRDQTTAIDPNMANPLCIVSGIKLTPKEDAQWDAKSKLAVVNYGEISYNICLRASGLYSFAQKEENQKEYGLYPYVNPDDDSDRGGSFSDVYKTFNDSYTLINTVKEGWFTEDGGFAYYKNGEKLTGVEQVDGYYYDFGQSGINVGQTKYTGLFAKDANTYYAFNGELVSGWQAVGQDYYCFNGTDGAALVGEHTFTFDRSVTYSFASDGKLTSGVWMTDAIGSRYYYGPAYHVKGWQTIDGESYFFKEGYCYKGRRYIRESNSIVSTWYDFGENGALIAPLTLTGFMEIGENLYYLVDGVSHLGLLEVDGDYYYFKSSDCTAVRNASYYVYTLNQYTDFPQEYYDFGADGKMLNPPVDEPDAPVKNGIVREADGVMYYYVNGEKTYAGLIEIDGYYYYVNSQFIVVTGQYTVFKNNDLLPVGVYTFDEEGRMLNPPGSKPDPEPDAPVKNGIVREADGVMYYYVDGEKTYAGLIEIDGHY